MRNTATPSFGGNLARARESYSGSQADQTQDGGVTGGGSKPTPYKKRAFPVVVVVAVVSWSWVVVVVVVVQGSPWSWWSWSRRGLRR